MWHDSDRHEKVKKLNENNNLPYLAIQTITEPQRARFRTRFESQPERSEKIFLERRT